MTKSDFVDWKTSPVSQLFFKSVNENIKGLELELGLSAGIDPLSDRTKVGAIRAYRDVLEMDWFEEDNT
jgi:hypothetical protein